MPDGRRMATYAYAEAQVRPETFIPFIGGFVGGTDTRTSTVTMIFDQEGIFQTYTTSESEFGTGMGFSAGTGPGRIENQPRQAPDQRPER